MKEDKSAKATTKNKTNARPNSKNDSKIKDVEFKQVNEDFLEENEDKRLIVFISLAILVIVGTVIGLLVGCQKEEKEEPKKPDDEVVVPKDNTDGKKENKKEEEYTYEKPLPVVRKVTTSSKKKSNSNNNKDTTDDEEIITHIISFYLNDDNETKEVNDNETAPEYLPDGYSECKYYTDEELSEEFDFATKITEDKNIYMSCTLIRYSIEYDTESENIREYTVEDNDSILSDPIVSDQTFVGWYTDSEKTNQITALNKEIVKYADSNNTIYLYAKFATGDDEVIDAPADGNGLDSKLGSSIEASNENETLAIDDENKENQFDETESQIEENLDNDENKDLMDTTLSEEEKNKFDDKDSEISQDNQEELIDQSEIINENELIQDEEKVSKEQTIEETTESKELDNKEKEENIQVEEENEKIVNSEKKNIDSSVTEEKTKEEKELTLEKTTLEEKKAVVETKTEETKKSESKSDKKTEEIKEVEKEEPKDEIPEVTEE